MKISEVFLQRNFFIEQLSFKVHILLELNQFLWTAKCHDTATQQRQWALGLHQAGCKAWTGLLWPKWACNGLHWLRLWTRERIERRETQDVEVPNDFLKLSPTVGRLSSIFQRWCMDFKWSSLIPVGLVKNSKYLPVYVTLCTISTRQWLQCVLYWTLCENMHVKLTL